MSHILHDEWNSVWGCESMRGIGSRSLHEPTFTSSRVAPAEVFSSRHLYSPKIWERFSAYWWRSSHCSRHGDEKSARRSTSISWKQLERRAGGDRSVSCYDFQSKTLLYVSRWTISNHSHRIIINKTDSSFHPLKVSSTNLPASLHPSIIVVRCLPDGSRDDPSNDDWCADCHPSICFGRQPIITICWLLHCLVCKIVWMFLPWNYRQVNHIFLEHTKLKRAM